MKKKPPAWRVSCGNVLWGLLFCLLQLNGATKEFSRCFIFKNCVLRNCQVESVGAFAGVEQVSCKVFLVTARRMHNSFPIVVRSGRCVFALAQSFLCIMQSGVQASFCHLAQIDLAVCCCTVAQYKLLAMAKKVQHNANVVETKKNPHNIHYVVEKINLKLFLFLYNTTLFRLCQYFSRKM